MFSRKVLMVTVLVLAVLGAVAATQSGVEPIQGQVPCGTAISCPEHTPHTPDTNVRSVALITHHEAVAENARRVQPNAGEDWKIAAKYVSLNQGVTCPCDDITYEAYVSVDWDAGAELFTRTAQNFAAPFRGIDLACGDESCTDQQAVITHGYGYRIGVDLDHTVWIECPDPDNWTAYYLQQVLYTTSAIDNGSFLSNTYCVLGASCSPTSQTYQVGDNGAWDCQDGSCPTQITLDIKYN